MTPTANLASTEADAENPAAPAAEAGPFVLNLCSSTTPMALAQTDIPELKRFTFFVSRRFEEGRERFRLHMGFFDSQAEAEEWLSLVREIYPGAWAGEAPGKKLRARAAEAAATQARHAVGPQKTAAPAAAPVPTPPTPSVARPQGAQRVTPPKIPTLVPTLHPPAPAPASASAAMPARPMPTHPAKAGLQTPPKRSSPPPAPAARAAAPAAPRGPGPAQSAAAARPLQGARPSVASPAPAQSRTGTAPPVGQRPAVKAAPVKPAAPSPSRPVAAPLAPAARAKPLAPPAAARQAPQGASRPTSQPPKKPIFSDSNVKEVLAALDTSDGTGQTRVMPTPLGHDNSAVDDSSLTDTQVLRFLEIRRGDDDAARAQPALQVDAAAESGISLLKPDDTGTRRALKEAVSHNEPVSFAVQLQWSVQPVELDKVPPLAIFSAYTLYSVEGSREGRKWYGLRLGFFNDAISAKQVAYYVRSEFTSVAVVPVSPGERERATEDNQRFTGVGAPRKRRETDDNEFKLIDSDETPSPAPAPAAAPPVAAARAAAAPSPASAPNKAAATARTARKAAGKVTARERRAPQTLEETLEILGANDLAIDNGRGEPLNDTGVRHLRVEVQKNTPFSRLLERLSERVKKS